MNPVNAEACTQGTGAAEARYRLDRHTGELPAATLESK
jgi:hypothetical protein